jgi:predicted nucleic acid-binding protein
MWYFDTNILVYSIISVDESKMLYSQALINDCIRNDRFLISPVSLQELIFVLAKLKVETGLLKGSFHSFLKYSRYEMDSAIVKDAFKLCSGMDFCKNINDAIHLKFAEKYCRKLLTYDEDFKKFKPLSKIDIEIIPSPLKQ